MTSQRASMRPWAQLDANGALELRDDEELILVSRTEMSFDPSEASLGEGTTFVTNKRMVWVGDSRSFDYDIAYIGLHAITHDTVSFPRPCLYCQFDVEDESSPADCYFVPKPSGNSDDTEAFEKALRALFDALSQAASMNPDEEDDGSQELVYNPEEVELGAAQVAALNHLDSVFQEPDQK